MAVKKDNSTDAGVSESIGFVLIFSMVIAGIGLVTLYGYPMLLQQQTSANERIMEKNMIVLQNDIKSLAYKTVPYKESALKIEGGTLAVYNTLSTNPTATFKIYDNSVDYVTSYHPGDLRYESIDAQTDISLQNGAVMKYQQSGSVMLAEPRWFHDTTTNTWVINLIAINSSGMQSRTGISTVKMALADNPEYIYTDTIDTEIHIEYTPDLSEDFSTAWDNYFQIGLKMGPPTAIIGSTRTYTLPIDSSPPSPPPRLVIKKYEVMIESL